MCCRLSCEVLRGELSDALDRVVRLLDDPPSLAPAIAFLCARIQISNYARDRKLSDRKSV